MAQYRLTFEVIFTAEAEEVEIPSIRDTLERRVERMIDDANFTGSGNEFESVTLISKEEVIDEPISDSGDAT